jgi:hypothetical protein
MKRRDPNTLEDALAKIVGELTAEGAGAVIGKTSARIYAAMDVDRDNYSPLNMAQCKALDVAFNDATGRGHPHLEVYSAQVKALSPHRAMTRRERIVQAVTEHAEAVAAFADDTASEADVDREISEAITALENMRLDRAAGLKVVRAAS